MYIIMYMMCHIYDTAALIRITSELFSGRLLRILFVSYYHEGSNLRGGEHLLNFGPR